MTKKIKSIFFDFAGVISKESHLAEGYLYPNLKNFLSFEQVNTKYKLARLGKINFNEMIKGAPKELWLKHLRKAKANYYAEKTFINLHKKYKLFVASNHVPILFEKELNSFEIKKYFEKIFVSYKLKINKPHKKFYELILKKSNSKPTESVFIDDAKINLVEPKKMGFVTIWFDIKKERTNKRNTIKFQPDYTIKSLKEIPKIIKEIEA